MAYKSPLDEHMENLAEINRRIRRSINPNYEMEKLKERKENLQSEQMQLGLYAWKCDHAAWSARTDGFSCEARRMEFETNQCYEKIDRLRWKDKEGQDVFRHGCALSASNQKVQFLGNGDGPISHL